MGIEMPFSGKLQTETNEMKTRETKYQTDFYSAKKYQY